jgi:hypothetical protein
VAHHSDILDPVERAREKQASREADARAIARGEKSRAQVTAENSFIRAEWIDVDEIDYSRMVF